MNTTFYRQETTITRKGETIKRYRPEYPSPRVMVAIGNGEINAALKWMRSVERRSYFRDGAAKSELVSIRRFLTQTAPILLDQISIALDMIDEGRERDLSWGLLKARSESIANMLNAVYELKERFEAGCLYLPEWGWVTREEFSRINQAMTEEARDLEETRKPY